MKSGFELENCLQIPASGKVRTFLSEALGQRRREVQREFDGACIGASEPDPAAIARVLGKSRAPISLSGYRWYGSAMGMESSLFAFAADQPVPLTGAAASPAAFPAMIRKKEIQAASNLVDTRYACPVNFLHPTEGRVYEEVLRFLMVVDRAQLMGEIEERLRWLLLNLVALRCRTIRDLRGLDVLNYYWENLFRPLPQSALVFSFIGNYDACLEDIP